jgi:outer membrane protein assembly factor BamB
VGGATVVNDLVFTATFNGIIYAFNKKTGEKLFEYQAPGGINGQPAVAGDTIVFPIGVSSQPCLLALKIG